MQKPTRRASEPRRFLGMPAALAIILGLLVLGAGGAVIGIAASRSAGAAQLTEGLKKAAYYAGKDDFDDALKILNTLSIDDPRVKAALDDVLARKKAADDASKQSELTALKAQQDQLKQMGVENYLSAQLE